MIIEKQVTLTGWISTQDRGESDGVLVVAESDPYGAEPFAEMLEFMHYRNVTVRYWIANERCTIEEAQEDFIGTLMGRAESRFCARYSDITGYLWTDEDLKVGGHDLVNELKSSEGRYLIFQVEVHKS